MSLILGFVNKKVRLGYATYKGDKMPTARGGENRRAIPGKPASPSFCALCVRQAFFNVQGKTVYAKAI